MPKVLYRMMLPRLKGLDHEEFWVILLNRANYVIHKEMISLGGISSTVVDPSWWSGWLWTNGPAA